MTQPVPRPHSARCFRAVCSPLAWTVLVMVFSLGLFLDLWSKSWAFTNVISNHPILLDRMLLLAQPEQNPIPRHDGLHVLPWNLLDLRLVVNRGAVFGIGTDQRIFFILFTIAALLGAFYMFVRHTTARSVSAHIGLGLVLAGGIGNLHDRIVLGVVRDFLHMMPNWTLPFDWRYPRFLGGGNEIFPWVFNPADVMLLFGMVLLMLFLHRRDHHTSSDEQMPFRTTSSATTDPAGL